MDYDQDQQHNELITAIRAITDPVSRVLAIDTALTVLLDTQSLLAQLRRDAIHDMLNTMNKSEVARLLGVTRGRISQLVGTNTHYPARYKRAATVPSEDT